MLNVCNLIVRGFRVFGIKHGPKHGQVDTKNGAAEKMNHAQIKVFQICTSLSEYPFTHIYDSNQVIGFLVHLKVSGPGPDSIVRRSLQSL